MTMLVGIDVGTSATKVLAIDERGDVRHEASVAHEVARPRPGWSEQDPDAWWRAAATALRRIVDRGMKPGEVAGVGFSGQMHGSVFLGEEDGDGRRPVIRPALLWNDQRTAAECREIEAAAGGRDRLVEFTGNVALTGFTAPKLLWLRRHEPAHHRATRRLLLPKDHVRYRLSGELTTDVGDASGTLLFDPFARDWRWDLVEALGIDPEILPPVRESRDLVGRVSPGTAEETGLRAGTPVVAGSGDQMAGAVGNGIVRAGAVGATLGTSGVVFAHAGVEPPANPGGRLQVMCSAVPDEWCVYGCMLSAAGALEWARRVLAPAASHVELDEEAARVPPGAEGLFFLPYLTGERCPHPNPDARGAWIGLTARHERGHLVRAVLEGVAAGMGHILELARDAGVTGTSAVAVGGGGARSDLWREILAEAFDRPVATTNTADASAYGAALLAGAGVGVWDGVAAAAEATVRSGEAFKPSPERAAKAAARGALHRSLYESLAPLFPRLGDAANVG